MAWHLKRRLSLEPGTEVCVALGGEHVDGTVVAYDRRREGEGQVTIELVEEAPRPWQAGATGWVVWPNPRVTYRQALLLAQVEGRRLTCRLTGQALGARARARRVPVSLPVEIAHGAAGTFKGMSRDISESGVRFWTSHALTAGAQIRLTLKFRAGDFAAGGRVVRAEWSGRQWDVAVAFEHLLPHQRVELRSLLERARLH